MVKVEGAKNFGIGLGLIVEDALFAVRLDFTIFQVEIECEGSIFLHDDQVTVIDLGCPLTEQHAAGGNAVLLIAPSAIMQKHFLGIRPENSSIWMEP